jgi:hypothetical protein
MYHQCNNNRKEFVKSIIKDTKIFIWRWACGRQLGLEEVMRVRANGGH